MEFSICMIVKNEEKHIENCLRPLSKLGYEIIVVDTGSTDKTVELSKKYTDKVYFFEWVNNFAKAKNYAISMATNDYIFVIDADEYIIEFDKKSIEDFFAKNPDKVGRLKRIEHIIMDNGDINTSTSYTNRFFNKNLYEYAGAIHEQLVKKANSRFKYETKVMNAVADHVGYNTTEEDKLLKAKRNIKILETELKKYMTKEQEKEYAPYIFYHLGKSYYYIKDYEKAVDYFNKAMYYDVDTKLEYVNDMVISFGYCLLNLQRHEDALLLEKVYDAFSNSADFVYLMGHVYMNNAMFVQAVEEFKKATTFKTSNVRGVNSYLSYYNMGVIYEVAGDLDSAIKFYKKASNYIPAMKRLQNIKN